MPRNTTTDTACLHAQASRAGQVAYTEWTQQQRYCVSCCEHSAEPHLVLLNLYNFGARDFQV